MPGSRRNIATLLAALGNGFARDLAGFTDSAVRDPTALADYRVLHFAAHGLVTAPRPGCRARPAR